MRAQSQVPHPMPSKPACTARVHGSELCPCLPLGTWQAMEAPERGPGCVRMGLSFQCHRSSPREQSLGRQVEGNTSDPGFRSDCAVGLAVTSKKVEKKGKRNRGVRGLLLVLLPPPARTSPTGLRLSRWAGSWAAPGLLLPPAQRRTACPSAPPVPMVVTREKSGERWLMAWDASSDIWADSPSGCRRRLNGVMIQQLWRFRVAPLGYPESLVGTGLFQPRDPVPPRVRDSRVYLREALCFE